MKYALLCWLILCGCIAHADEPDSPGLHFFVVPSPANTCFAVHTVTPWQAGGDITQYGQIQLCRTDTGAELWRMDGVFCYRSELFPADDGRHLAIVRSQFRSSGLDTLAVVSLYAEGKLLASYTLKELGFDLGKLRTSVSHASFVSVERPENSWQWAWPLGTKDTQIAALITEPNPRWDGTNLVVKAIDGQTFLFDGRTGKRLLSVSAP